MHFAQKTAVIAMINSIEAQLAAVKQIIGMDTASAMGAPAHRTHTMPRADDGYATAQEEAALEEALAAERELQLKEGENLLAAAMKRRGLDADAIPAGEVIRHAPEQRG